MLFVDLELFERAFAGDDPQALNEFILQIVDDVHTLAFRLMRDADDAADVTQEVMFRIVRLAHMEKPRPPISNPGSFLHRMTVNTALRALRSRAHARQLEEVEVPVVDPARVAAVMGAIDSEARSSGSSAVAEGRLSKRAQGRYSALVAEGVVQPPSNERAGPPPRPITGVDALLSELVIEQR